MVSANTSVLYVYPLKRLVFRLLTTLDAYKQVDALVARSTTRAINKQVDDTRTRYHVSKDNPIKQP